MSTMIRRRHKRRQRGFTLIEVLVSLIVLAIGLLGLAQLQARGLKFNQDAYARSQATVLAYEMIDRMRANRDNVASYVSAHPGPTEACDQTSSVVNVELACWHGRVAQALPGGQGNISVNLAPDYYAVVISWTDRESGGTKQQSWVTYP